MDNQILQLYKTVLERKESPAEGSYTCYLFSQGIDKILKKIGEECAETIIAAKNYQNSPGSGGAEALTGEICDLFYHITVMLAELSLPIEPVFEELERRSSKIGNLKQMKVSDKNT